MLLIWYGGRGTAPEPNVAGNIVAGFRKPEPIAVRSISGDVRYSGDVRNTEAVPRPFGLPVRDPRAVPSQIPAPARTPDAMPRPVEPSIRIPGEVR